MFVFFDLFMVVCLVYLVGFLVVWYQIKGDNGLGGKGGYNLYLRDEWIVSLIYFLGLVVIQILLVKGNKLVFLQILLIYLFFQKGVCVEGYCYRRYEGKIWVKNEMCQ